MGPLGEPGCYLPAGTVTIGPSDMSTARRASLADLWVVCRLTVGPGPIVLFQPVFTFLPWGNLKDADFEAFERIIQKVLESRPMRLARLIALYRK